MAARRTRRQKQRGSRRQRQRGGNPMNALVDDVAPNAPNAPNAPEEEPVAPATGGKRNKRHARHTRKQSKKGGTPWTKFVTSVYREMKQKDSSVKLRDAMKEASRRKKRGEM